MFDLRGKVALVFGGRGFLGRHFCTGLADSGAKVVSVDLPNPSMATISDQNHNHTPSPKTEQSDLDVRQPEAVKEFVSSVIEKKGRIDIMVYAVTSKPNDFFASYTDCSFEGWKQVVHGELDGLFLTTQQVGKQMEAQRSGSVILMSSIYGMVGNDHRIYEGSNLAEVYCESNEKKQNKIFSHASYSATKAAQINLARFLAAYWGEYGIRVNSISPGGVHHPAENEQFVQNYSNRTPLMRKANIGEITSAMLFMASDSSSYITGHNLVVDGGWTAW